MTQEQIQMVTDAVGIGWNEYKRRHPGTARVIERNLGNPVVPVMAALQRDEQFAALMAKTDAETDVVEIVKVLVPAVLNGLIAVIGKAG